MSRSILTISLSVIAIFLMLAGTSASAQTTEFTYQGSLNNGVSPANGNYDIEIDVFDAATGGNYFNTITATDVPVVNGIFSLKLNLGANIFPGAARFLQVKVRQSGGSAWTVLEPRQQVTSTPYAVQSLKAATATNAENAAQLGGIAASQFVQTNDSRLSDARDPLPGSNNYVRILPTSTSGGQTGHFSVSGTGRASILEANELRLPFSGTFLAGTTNGSNNLQLGVFTGSATAGTNNNNVFVGWSAGRNITTGSGNTFTGSGSGYNNATGGNNSYYGSLAGEFAINSSFNSAFGHASGRFTTGTLNSFFGTGAGNGNGSGNSNAFFGHDAGNFNTSGSANTAIGENADFAASNLTNATAIGSKASVGQSNAIVLGSINGVNGATADTNVGIGTSTPASKLHVNGTIRVTNGAVYITNPNTIIITSPNGACWGITVNNSGGLATFPITPCP